MVYIYTACCNYNDYSDVVNGYMQYFPESLMSKASSFKFERDSHRYVLGKILLIKGITLLGYNDLTLDDLHFDEFKKPYFANDLNFNISHSGDYVLCGLSRKCRVGIDLEEISNIDRRDFLGCFTEREWSHINNANDPLRTFYQFWTKKEAVIKADGRALHIPLSSFEVINDAAAIDTRQWYITELAIADNYSAHLATDIKINDEYSIQQLVI
jgi:4'-phosphopantetheinyl transferase